METINDGSLQRYLTFYSPEEYKYPEGGYAEWVAAAPEKLLHEPSRERIIELGSIQTDEVGEGHVRSRFEAVVVTAGDTSRVQYVMIWKAEGDTWRIIREKRLAPADGE
jgi:hypothetical protein